MQTYECSQCGRQMPSVFECFLHIFTDHRGQDVGLLPKDSAQLLAQCQEYRPAEGCPN